MVSSPTSKAISTQTLLRAIAVALLLGGIAALLAASWRTRDSVEELRLAQAQRAVDKGQSLVDASPLTTARTLAAASTLPDEQPLASEALRLSDHEVDQAFATALRDSAQPSTPTDRKGAQLQQQAAALAAKVKAEQQEVTRLQAAESNAKDPDDAAQAVELAQAQLSLDQDDLEDTKQVLTAAGSDRHSQLEQAQKSHEALEEKAPSPQVSIPELKTLAQRHAFWQSLRDRRAQVLAAESQDDAVAAAVRQKRSARAASEGPATQVDTGAPTKDRTSAIAHLKALELEKRALTEYDHRLDDLKQLSVVYARWSALLDSRARLQVHYMVRTCAWLLLLLIAVVALDGLIRGYFRRLPAERSWLHNLRVFLLALLYTAAVITALVLVFGRPSEFETVLGLVGAGLTVALKDFIVGFLGWFFLAGSNGVRVGDVVEIEGVAGEVVEVGLLRTVLFETGNWTETGHPTGRRVSFLNTYAVQGHYFNFTTHGQWLWDEILVPLPNDVSMYRIADELVAAMLTETQQDVTSAGEEWDVVTRKYGIKAFSPRPTVDVRPSASGPEAVVRYVSRAECRAETRARLHRAAIEVLHKPNTANGTAESR